MKKALSTAAKKKLVIAALEDIKAHDILAIDVRKVTPIFDWIIIASADSGRQTKALARNVRDKLKEAGSTLVGTEGEETGEWILVDAGDIVAHVMQPAVRHFYNLEELWGEGKFDKVVNSSSPVEAARRRKPTAKKKKKKAATPRKKHAASSRRAA
ncbi:MAG TPA: ribosome silencing factor [Usitatibacter sp.]|nr:ribosome silencing factor [Usitatibacter sp.]